MRSRIIITILLLTILGSRASFAAPSTIQVAPSSGSGYTQSFTFTYSDAGGGGNVRRGLFIFNNTLNAVAACYVEFNRQSNTLGLVTDNGLNWIGYIIPGTASTLENNQCKISASASTSYISGTNLVLTVAVEFKTGFAGAKNTYMLAEDMSYALSNGGTWLAKGTWVIGTANQPPSVMSSTPSFGSGAQQSFSFAYGDPNGYWESSKSSIHCQQHLECCWGLLRRIQSSVERKLNY